MTEVNQTLYIPLYGKALVSRQGILLSDRKAEEIWEKEGFPLKGKSKSRWLAYYMAMRAAVFDNWLTAQMHAQPESVVLHIGCGLDSRCERVGCKGHPWYDVDFPDVIAVRRQYYSESEFYHMLAGDARESAWLAAISGNLPAIVVSEGISMYLEPEALRGFLRNLGGHFPAVRLLMDCYTVRGAKMTKLRNPVSEVGVTETYGIDNPQALTQGTGFALAGEPDMTPPELIAALPGTEQSIFRSIYAGSISRSMYRMYEFQTEKEC